MFDRGFDLGEVDTVATQHITAKETVDTRYASSLRFSWQWFCSVHSTWLFNASTDLVDEALAYFY